MSDPKEEVQNFLVRLREGTIDYTKLIRWIREDVQDGHFSLEDIGTSEKEFEEFRIKGRKIFAQKWLNLLRNGTEDYDHYIDYLHCLREDVQDGHFSLADIGTNEEEFAKLHINSFKLSAQKQLSDLRNGTGDYLDIPFLREDLCKSNLSLADIGTSEEELSSFARTTV